MRVRLERVLLVAVRVACLGDLLQMDTKRLARFSRPGHKVNGDRFTTGAEKRQRVGWEFCHSMIDDHSRLAYTEIHRDEKAPPAARARRALGFFAVHGISAQRVPARPELRHDELELHECEPSSGRRRRSRLEPGTDACCVWDFGRDFVRLGGA